MMLYDCNVGVPVVDAGSELVDPSGPGTCVSAASSPDDLERPGRARRFR